MSRIASAATSSAVGRGLRVAGQERVDEHGLAVVLQREGRVTEEADVHQRSSPVSLDRMSSWASSRPTATPTSMPRRVSSATSVRISRRRSSGSSSDGGLAELRLVGAAEPAALGQRLVEHVLQPRRRVGDDLLGVGEALGVGQRRDRGVDLLGAVSPVGHRGPI